MPLCPCSCRVPEPSTRVRRRVFVRLLARFIPSVLTARVQCSVQAIFTVLVAAPGLSYLIFMIYESFVSQKDSILVRSAARRVLCSVC